MAILNKKIQASTLVEVIVSMLIILICFGFALTAIDSNSRSHNTKAIIKAEQCVLMVKDKTMHERRFLDEEIKYDNIKIVKKISDYSGSSELKILEIKALDMNNKTLVTQRELIVAE